jgi:hypothetical protein
MLNVLCKGSRVNAAHVPELGPVLHGADQDSSKQVGDLDILELVWSTEQGWCEADSQVLGSHFVCFLVRRDLGHEGDQVPGNNLAR